MSTDVIMYRDEFVQKFERAKSYLENTVTTEAMISGGQATFLVAGSSGEAITRGADGLIPYSQNSRTQYTATLKEKHSAERRTDFNIFKSQGDARAMMYQACIAKTNRAKDAEILDTLAAATVTTGGAAKANLDMVLKSYSTLGNADVSLEDGEVYAVVTPAFIGELSKVTEFASKDYVTDTKFENTPHMFKWQGINWIRHTGLPGVGTASETCYLYHKGAVGFAYDNKNIEVSVGYNEEQRFSYTIASLKQGGTLLQNAGVVKMIHDGSGMQL